MKAIRSTAYMPPDFSQITIVLAESELSEPIEEVARELLEAKPDIFYIVEIFESRNENIIEITIEGKARQEARQDRERNMSLMYYWTAHQLTKINPRGVLSGTRPAPLTSEEIKEVYRHLAVHSNYRHHTIINFDEKGDMIRLIDGEIR